MGAGKFGPHQVVHLRNCDLLWWFRLFCYHPMLHLSVRRTRAHVLLLLLSLPPGPHSTDIPMRQRPRQSNQHWFCHWHSSSVGPSSQLHSSRATRVRLHLPLDVVGRSICGRVRAGMNLISNDLKRALFVIGDLLSKNCWVGIAVRFSCVFGAPGIQPS